MNKADLISVVATKIGITKSDSEKAIDAVFGSIIEALCSDDEVRLTGFGSFGISHRAASDGRNPRTGEPISIPAKKLVKFNYF